MQTDDPVDRASEDDRMWFEMHPERSHRIRPYIPGEWPMEVVPTPTQAAVRQIQPGVRARLPLLMEGQPGPGEFAARRLFDIALGGPDSTVRSAVTKIGKAKPF